MRFSERRTEGDAKVADDAESCKQSAPHGGMEAEQNDGDEGLWVRKPVSLT